MIFITCIIYLSIYLFHQTTIYDFQMTKGYKGTTYNISAHKGLQKTFHLIGRKKIHCRCGWSQPSHGLASCLDLIQLKIMEKFWQRLRRRIREEVITSQGNNWVSWGLVTAISRSCFLLGSDSTEDYGEVLAKVEKAD